MSKIIRTAPRLPRSLEVAAQAQRDARFGVGGSCSPRTVDPTAGGYGNCGDAMPPAIPECDRPIRICDAGRMSITKVVQGGSSFTLDLQPQNSAYFQITAARMRVTELNDSDWNHRVLITSVRRGASAIESFDDTAPVAPTAAGETIDGMWSDEYFSEEGAVPVNWGKVSTEVFHQNLRLYGLALGVPASTLLLVTLTCVGNAIHARA